MMTKGEFSTLLDSLLHRERLSVAELAKRIGTGVATIYSWLDEQNPKMPQGRNLTKLAKALNAPELAVDARDLESEVVAKLADILDLIRDGVSPERAAERVIGSVSAAQRERLVAVGSPAVQGKVSAALPSDWDRLSPADREKAVRALAQETE